MSNEGTFDVEKCKSVLEVGINKIRSQQINWLPLTHRGLLYLEKLLCQLLVSILSSQPKTLQDAKEQITRKFQESLAKLAIDEANIAMEKGKKKVAISVDKLHHVLKEKNSGMEKQVTLLLCAVLEYIIQDVMKLATNYVTNISSSRKRIDEQDIEIAMYADKVLMDVFHGDALDDEIPLLPVAQSSETVEKISYESLVRNIMAEETRYLRDLNLIIKLIRKAFVDAPNIFSEKDIDSIFSNIEDLAELSVTVLGLLEEATEMTDENSPVPKVGYCFEDLAEECSLEIYTEYANVLMAGDYDDNFDRIVLQPTATEYFATVYEGFRDIVVYVLPRLLLGPIYHCLHYFEHLKLLEPNSPTGDDKKSLSQAASAMATTKIVLESLTSFLPKQRPTEASLRMSWRGSTKGELSDIEKSIEGWYGRSLTQQCNEFLHEGDIVKVNGKRTSERRMFLFDLLIVCCKVNQARRPMQSAANVTHEYRLKEKILLRKAEIRDLGESTDTSTPPEYRQYQFEIIDGESNTRHVFATKTKSEKWAWMSHLVRLQYRSMYDRMLDQAIKEEQAKQELRLPSPEVYRFLEPDSETNIILEDMEEGNVPVIRGGTVLKLVERLTYHLYTDPGFTKTFLTTYRSFCKPQQLLDLLIERFNIPEPPPSPEQQLAISRGEIVAREDLKRFRKEFVQLIQLRVMNVIRQWLEHHWYDFKRDPELLHRVEAFVSSVRGKNLQKWARTMIKIIQRKDSEEENTIERFFSETPPAVEWFIAKEGEVSKYSLMTLHPLEIGRQLTLIEFDYYRNVQPSEMIGSVWTKVDKETNSPNLLKMIHFTTKITRWIARTIVETMNQDERIAVMVRAVEVMQVFKQLNNFNGMLQLVSAFNSSAVHRLKHTKNNLPEKYSKVVDECMDLFDSRLTKCMERLRSIDPPCVPFVGTFLTNILKTEEGNPHLLPNYPEELELINFSKRRKVAAMMLEVQQYQNQPYNLQKVPSIHDFFMKLDPLDGYSEKEYDDYMYDLSLKIEPRDLERPPKFAKSYSEKELKSPGIIPSKRSASRATVTREESMSMTVRSQVEAKRKSIMEIFSIDTSASDAAQESTPSTPEVSSPASASSVSDSAVKTPTTIVMSPPPVLPPRAPSRITAEPPLISAPPVIRNKDTKFSFADIESARAAPATGITFSSADKFNFDLPSFAQPITNNIPATSIIQSEPVIQRKPPAPEPSPLDNTCDTPPPLPPRDNVKPAMVRAHTVDSTSPPPLPPRDSPPPTVPPRQPVGRFAAHHPNTPGFMSYPNANFSMAHNRYVPEPWSNKSAPLTAPCLANHNTTNTSFFNSGQPPPETDFQNLNQFNFPQILRNSNQNTPSLETQFHPSNPGPSIPEPNSPPPPPIPSRQPSTHFFG